MKISVIVPVYNTEAFLPQCLDSLRRQTLEDIEFLLINDGSTDDSGRIMDEFADRDPRFRVIHQENRGFAGSRNRGLAEARGEFLGFVDSDDWIDPAMYSRLWECVSSDPETDIAQCSFRHEFVGEGASLPHDNRMVRKALTRSGGRLRGAESLLLDDGTIWNRIYRREMIVTNGLEFDPAMTFGEDVYFAWTALISARRIAAIPECFYHYRANRPGSQVASRDRRIFAYFRTMEGFDRYIAEHSLEVLRPWVNHLKLSYLTWGCERLLPELHREYFDEFRAFLERSGVTERAPIAYPPSSGDLMYNLRYLLLRILHPLTLRAVLRGNFARFERIVAFRRRLAALPAERARKKSDRRSRREGE